MASSVPCRRLGGHPDAGSVGTTKDDYGRFLRREIHVICDNYGTHKHPKVREWLKAHPRFHFHFTRTSASWLNLVERWFGLVTTQVIRRGSFDSVPHLERAIRKYLEAWNEDAKPFIWTKTPRQIRKKVHAAGSCCSCETGHYGALGEADQGGSRRILRALVWHQLPTPHDAKTCSCAVSRCGWAR